KITITISNRGLRLADKQPVATDDAASNERRGWGLKLIRGLMDDVKIEDTDDGTRITMVKRLAAVA
ncbi:MAG: ATP-binding protein, partial [Pyrinomonadaceae bacterium]|nr:ATP-binding protein [Pyrinomonadaceae bacterium]